MELYHIKLDSGMPVLNSLIGIYLFWVVNIYLKNLVLTKTLMNLVEE